MSENVSVHVADPALHAAAQETEEIELLIAFVDALENHPEVPPDLDEAAFWDAWKVVGLPYGRNTWNVITGDNKADFLDDFANPNKVNKARLSKDLRGATKLVKIDSKIHYNTLHCGERGEPKRRPPFFSVTGEYPGMAATTRNGTRRFGGMLLLGWSTRRRYNPSVLRSVSCAGQQ